MDTSIKAFCLKHLTLLISSALSAFIVLRILGVANWNMTTALALLEFGDTSKIIIGGVIVSMPSLFILVAILIYTSYMPLGTVTPSKALLEVGLLTIGIVIILFSHILTAVNIVVVIAFLVILYRVSRRKRQDTLGKTALQPIDMKEDSLKVERMLRKLNKQIMWSRGIALVGYIFLLAVSSMIPWLPQQSIVPTDGQVYTGYVVSEAGDTIVVLKEDGRTIREYDNGAVTYALCSGSGWMNRTTAEVIWHEPYEPCPK